MAETRTLQCWPGGQSFTFEGDIHGPKRRLREGYKQDAKWRKGKASEWRQIEIEVLAEIYADRDVLACQSSLVDDLIKADFDGFQIDDIENLNIDPSEWDIDACKEYADDHGIEPLDDDASERDWQNHIRDNAESAEVYEWWLVSSWLCRQLRSIGEVVIDNGQGCWWGRTCTGQGYLMDGTLQKIAASFVDSRS